MSVIMLEDNVAARPEHILSGDLQGHGAARHHAQGLHLWLPDAAPIPPTSGNKSMQQIERVRLYSEPAASVLRANRGSKPLHELLVQHSSGDQDLKDDLQVTIPFIFSSNRNGLEPDPNFTYSTNEQVATQYSVHERVGGGSFSDVYQCTSRRQGTAVCLKVLKAESLGAGLAEIRALAVVGQSLGGHPHIVKLLECFYYRERLHIVTEQLHDSLFAHYNCLETQGRRQEYYTALTLSALAAQMLGALAFLAQHGITHCDVKTPNICIVDEDRRLFKLIDFGSAVFSQMCMSPTCRAGGSARPR
jgi:hypothetical protein